jgi:protoporphyrinogen oxidase
MTQRVVVLGAGPAGLGAAYRLSSLGLAQVTVLEQQACVGGNAGSFDLEGMRLDYGSHRLHPACAPAILNDLRRLLGNDLLRRPRHGRIRLRKRWIHFPLKPVDLVLNLPPSFVWGVGRDLAMRPFAKPAASGETFAAVLERGLGRTMCRQFYFPYAKKIWGVDPHELSPEQARRRVSAGSPAALLRKILLSIPGFKPPGAGSYYYPRRGYGQISECLATAVCASGGEVLTGARVSAVEYDGKHLTTVRFMSGEEQRAIETRYVWSTLPIGALVQCLHPAAPPPVLDAARAIRFRGMILVYLVLEQDRFTEYDAHYFPDGDVPLTRLSEPKNYSLTDEPGGITALCAEVPADPGSAEWHADDEALGRALCDWLGAAGLPVRSRVIHVATRRLPNAYPIYLRGHEQLLAEMERWLEGIDGLLTFGRQGLFAHDNLHHALYMAYSAAACFRADAEFDHEQWRTYRKIFDTHVVED